jgi:hypothetical protein
MNRPEGRKLFDDLFDLMRSAELVVSWPSRGSSVMSISPSIVRRTRAVPQEL